MLFSVWTLWVVVLGPSPTPSWMHTSAFLAFVAPLAILIFGVGLMFWRGKQDRDDFLSDLGFIPLSKSKRKEVERAFVDPEAIKIIPRAARLTQAYAGEWNGLAYQFLLFAVTTNKSQTDHTIVTLGVTPAPGRVSIFKTIPKSIRLLFIHRLKIGSRHYQRHWITCGDQSSAEFLITNDFESEMNSCLNIRGAHCFWSDNHLGFGFIGVPTRAGVQYCIEKTNALATAAGITE